MSPLFHFQSLTLLDAPQVDAQVLSQLANSHIRFRVSHVAHRSTSPGLDAGRALWHHPVPCPGKSALDLLVAWIEAQVVHRELPGLTMGIVHDQTLVWGRGFGWADVERREAATIETLYRIGSITKLFTATAIVMLRDAGKLGLDDPLTAYLPWFAMKSASPDAGSITIRHLLTHTSGLPREAAFPYWTDDRFPTVEEIGASPRCPGSPTPTSSGATSSTR